MTDDEDGLPATDDPYALLGIEENADERATKRAYARLIKRWRPDRAPDEFRRIQEAYDLVTRRRVAFDPGVAHPTAAEPEAAPPPADDPAFERERDALERRAGAVAEAQVTARARGDHREAAAALAAAIDDGVPLLALLAVTPVEHREYVATSPAVTWKRIAAHVDADDAARSLELVLELALAQTPASVAVTLLQDAALVQEAIDDVNLARVCLKAIAALGWRVPAPVPAQLLHAYQAVPRHPLIDRLLDRVELELGVGSHCLASGGGLPVPLFTMFRDASVVDHESYERLLEDVRADLERDVPRYVASFDRVAGTRGLTDDLVSRLLVDTPRDRLTPPSALQEMAGRLEAGSGRLWPVVLLIATVATVLVGLSIPPISAAGPVFALAGLGAVIVTVRETSRYRKQIRGELAAIIVAARVSTYDVRLWLTDRGKVGSVRYGRFGPALRDDASLDLLGRLVVMLRKRAEVREAAEEAEDEDERDERIR